MTKAPGTNEAAYLAFGMVSALIDTLVNKGALTDDDLRAMFATLSESVEHDPRTVAKSSALALREMIEKQ